MGKVWRQKKKRTGIWELGEEANARDATNIYLFVINKKLHKFFFHSHINKNKIKFIYHAVYVIKLNWEMGIV